MSVTFQSFDISTITNGYIPKKIRFYFSGSKKIGNYFYSYPISSESKSFDSAEGWADGNYTISGGPNGNVTTHGNKFQFDEIDNTFKDIQVFGVGERFMTNRRLFKVILNRKYVVELTEEMLSEGLIGFGCAKGGILKGEYKFGLFGNTLKLYPKVKHIEDAMKTLTEERNSRSKGVKITNGNGKYKVGNIYKNGSKTKDSYIFLGETPSKKHLFLEYNSEYEQYNTGTKLKTIIKNKEVKLTDIRQTHLKLYKSKPKYIIEQKENLKTFSFKDLETYLIKLKTNKYTSFLNSVKYSGFSQAYIDNAIEEKYNKLIYDIFDIANLKKITKITPGKIYSTNKYEGDRLLYIGETTTKKKLFVNLTRCNNIKEGYGNQFKNIKHRKYEDVLKSGVFNTNEFSWKEVELKDSFTFYYEEPNTIKVFSMKDLKQQITAQLVSNGEFLGVQNDANWISGFCGLFKSEADDYYQKEQEQRIKSSYSQILSNF